MCACMHVCMHMSDRWICIYIERESEREGAVSFACIKAIWDQTIAPIPHRAKMSGKSLLEVMAAARQKALANMPEPKPAAVRRKAKEAYIPCMRLYSLYACMHIITCMRIHSSYAFMHACMHACTCMQFMPSISACMHAHHNLYAHT